MFQGTTFSQTSTFTHRNDSSNLAPLSTWGRIQRQTDKIITSNVFQMTYIGVPLIVSGLIIKNEDDHFRVCAIHIFQISDTITTITCNIYLP